jgi:hypothetical protein
MALQTMADNTHLTQLRTNLLSLHKTLLDREHAAYERANGPARGGHLLQLVISHEQFAWLRSISAVVVRMDEALDEPESISSDTARKLVDEVRVLLAPSETGSVFQRNYHAAIQSDPAVAGMHGELRRALSAK